MRTTDAATATSAAATAVDVAVLGLGAMGGRMAARLLAAGQRVSVWNRTPTAADALVERGARRGASPAEAVAGAAVVIGMLRDDEASRAVWCDEATGALTALSRGALVVESSTLTVEWVKSLAARVHAAGGRFVDAPVVGSRPQAEAGELVHLLGGDASDVERAAPVLDALGGTQLHVGDVGSGAALKLAVNALFAVQVATLAELLPSLRRAGLDLPRALEALGRTAVASPALRGAGAAMLANVHAPLFPVELVEKDLRYAAAAAAPAPITGAALEVYRHARSERLGGLHLTAVARLYG